MSCVFVHKDTQAASSMNWWCAWNHMESLQSCLQDLICIQLVSIPKYVSVIECFILTLEI